MEKERIKILNNSPVKQGQYVIYWMQQSQREEYNHALEYAISQANKLKQPCVAYFGITDNYPGASERHYQFMLEGLIFTRKALEKRGLQLVIQHVSPEKGVCRLGVSASLVVTDRGYLSVQKQWRDYASAHLKCRLLQVESDVIVPVEAVSPKEEFSAATFRPKFNRLAEHFTRPVKRIKPVLSSLHLHFKCFTIDPPRQALKKMEINRDISSVSWLSGGTDEAKKHLKIFIRERLNNYTDRNDPSHDFQSNLGPYLHFGQISPLFAYLEINKLKSPASAVFIEELAVRRELSMNFVHYNPAYWSYRCIPEWAKKSLNDHLKDPRPYIYPLNRLENAETHDPYWNAAQRELVIRGKMHGYMRMYWGKKILEWTRDPDEAFRHAVLLNDKYSLDGRDANGYTGVAWCFGKHDRAWGERDIFGKVRYMNAAGLKRKFNMPAYLAKIDSLK